MILLFLFLLIAEEEEKISIPLQTMCAAIFDAILVNMMNTIDKKAWQPLREDMCNKLNKRQVIPFLTTSFHQHSLHLT